MLNRKTGLLASVIILVMIVEAVSLSGALSSHVTESSSNPDTTTQAPPANQLVLNTTVAGGGATFPQPLIAVWQAAYHAQYPNTTLTYKSVGSGAGQTLFLNKSVDFGASDAPLSTRQRTLVPGVLHIPETIGSVTASYNLPGIARGSLLLTGAVIANIFLGQVTMWNDPQITSLNPGLTLPAQTILVAHRSDSSGTTFVWTSWLCLDSATWCSTVGKGTTVNWPVGTGASGNGGVANYVNSTTYSLGYVELQYGVGHGLTYAKIQNPAGNYILPTEQTTLNAVNGFVGSLPTSAGDWSGVAMLNDAGSNSYPIASFTYLLVYKEMNVVPSMDLTDQAQFIALKRFLNWAVTTGQSYSSANNYVPLPAAVVSIDQAGINSMTFTYVSTPASPTVSLSIGSSGWNGANPGPSLTFVSGDHVTINFAATDSQTHRWYIDFNGDTTQDSNETNIQFSFSSSTSTPYPFTPIIWNNQSIPKAGTYTYVDALHPTFTGSITILPQQVAAPLFTPSSGGTQTNDVNSPLLPVVDTTRVQTVGSLIVDMRTNTASGNVTVVGADKTSAAITYDHGYVLSGLSLAPVAGQSGIQIRFIVNVAVSPFVLSSNILLQLQGLTATTSKSLTRTLDINGDGIVNIVDVGFVTNLYGLSSSQTGYDGRADLNGSGVINILGMGPLFANYGVQAFH